MKAAAIYVRQSIFKEDSLSISSQIEKCRSRLDEGDSHKIYDDSDFSGKDTDRPSFQKMKADIKNQEISKVIVYKIDRLTRNTRDFIDIYDFLKEHDVGLISVTEPIDTTTDLGRTIAILLASFGEMERMSTVRRVTDNYYDRAATGALLGGQAPFGFSIGKMKNPFNQKQIKYLVENENMFYVRKIYKRYLEGESLTKIAAYLNNRKVITPDFDRDLTKRQQKKNENLDKKPAWDSGKVSRLMRNVSYAKASPAIYNYFVAKGANVHNDIEQFKNTEQGLQLIGKRPAKDRKYTDVTNHTLFIMAHKGTIESEIWLAAQYKLDSNHQIRNTGKGQYSWLSGLVKCGGCGSSLIVKYSLTRKREKKYIYLSCSGRMNHGDSFCAGFSAPLKIEDIEPAVDREFLSYLKNFEDIKPIIDVPAEIREKEAEIDVNKGRIEKLLKILEDGDEDLEEVKCRLKMRQNEKKKLYEDLAKLSEENANRQQKSIDEIIQNWYSLDVNKKREIAKEFINKIKITEDDHGEIKVSIYYKIEPESI